MKVAATSSSSIVPSRRVQPERIVKKVLTINTAKGHKHTYEIEMKAPTRSGKTVYLRDYLDNGGTKSIPDWWKKTWKSLGNVSVSINKNQHGKYSIEVRNPTTKKIMINHSLSKDIVLKPHGQSTKPALMWMAPYDIGCEDDECGGVETLVCITFASDDDMATFEATWNECQGMMM